MKEPLDNHSTPLTGHVLNDIVQWDIRTWSNAITFWDKNIDWNKGTNCLALGEREGGLSLYLALKGKKVICSDLFNPKEIAEPLHTRYNVNQLITYENIDATDIPYENHFDIITFKSIIGGIGRNEDGFAIQQQVFEQIYKALKPNGILLFAENLTATFLHQYCRKKFVQHAQTWRYVSLKEFNTFLNPFKKRQLQTTGFLATFGRTELQRTTFAIFDKLIFNHIFPANWQYVVYGIAEK
ncbi:MAG: class I SAM-dependent methyltransferase [Planctomycetaceae bacterium]|jgi:2-polyprenyl-3-methyl-5-hydroxy-6-metoxy-1,4-benzoquinol methylase|nr:class I SAM-dependent methyltransferase [Planctomycetaceae bacterium]